jgi:hypothetical protein
VLGLFFFLHFFLTTRFNPLNWSKALLTGEGYFTEELPVVAPIFKGFVLAKQFAFSFVDHAAWAGVMNPPTTLSSPFMQMLVFILDLPSISYESFHAVLAAIFFLLAIIGSFGFYLFLKYAAKLHWLFCIFGGFLFFFSGAPFLSGMFIADGGILVSPYAMFPYALLLISIAFEKNDLRFSAWAGAALAAQFFFLSPHPEGVIYSLLFYGVFMTSLVYYSTQLSLKRRILLAITSFISFFILSAHSLIPVLYDQMAGNMYVFAHTGDIKHGKLADMKFYASMLALSMLASRLFLKNKITFSPVYLSALSLALFIGILMVLTWVTTVARVLAHLLHIGLHFWYIFRPGMYFILATFIVFLFILEELTKLSGQYILQKFPAFFGGTKR